MKTLPTLVIIACLIVPGCGRASNSSSNHFARQIEQVLAADKAISEKAKAEMSSGISRRLAISNSVARMRAIDTSGCPVEFRTAYLRHYHAWDAALQWLKSQPETFLEEFVVGFLKGLNGETDLSDQKDQQHLQSIRQTFEEVEVIAVRYGAKLP